MARSRHSRAVAHTGSVVEVVVEPPGLTTMVVVVLATGGRVVLVVVAPEGSVLLVVVVDEDGPVVLVLVVAPGARLEVVLDVLVVVVAPAGRTPIVIGPTASASPHTRSSPTDTVTSVKG